MSLERAVYSTCQLTGEFTLRSGQVADEYFDKYLFESDAAICVQVGPLSGPVGPFVGRSVDSATRALPVGSGSTSRNSGGVGNGAVGGVAPGIR